jgi:molybdopterin synthase catalytic subunit
MHDDNVDILLTDKSLDISRALAWADSPEAGGTCVFVGTVRRVTQGKTVVALEFEAYEPMAVAEMRKIAEAACRQWPVLRVAMHHRTGRLSIGEIPVVIVVSAAHRAATFAACQYCIDRLKQTVPIWKKEIFEDGEVWVAAHP